MSTDYVIMSKEPVPNSFLVNVTYAFGASLWGTITVHEALVDTPNLDTVIRRQLSERLRNIDALSATEE